MKLTPRLESGCQSPKYAISFQLKGILNEQNAIVVHHTGEETSSKPVSAEHNFPHFEMLEEGFSCIRMEPKSESLSDGDHRYERHKFDWDVVDATKYKSSSRVRQEEVKQRF